MENLYIGVEIGASKIQAALGDAEGSLHEIKQHKVSIKDGAKGILAWLQIAVHELISAASGRNGEVKVIGVGFGGILETAKGLSIASVQVPGWENFPVRGWFEEAFKLPTVVLNDTVAGGCGEYYRCTGRKAKVFFYTNIGSGIGGCLLYNGEWFDGSGFGGVYFGHTWIPNWTRKETGAFTKVETMCSGFGIEKRLRQPGYVPVSSAIHKLCGGNSEKITCFMLEEAAKKDDAFALEEINRLACSYALGLSNVITLFGVQEIVIGGGVAKMGELFFEPVREKTAKYVFFSAADKYTINQSKLMDDAVLSGAIVAASGRVKQMD